jgi:hypothetical protein
MKSNKTDDDHVIIYNTSAEKIDDDAILQYCYDIRMKLTNCAPSKKDLKYNTWSNIALISMLALNIGLVIVSFLKSKSAVTTQ